MARPARRARPRPGRHRRPGGELRPARPRRRGVPDRHQVATVLRRAGRPKYVVCNADEGDSGTFSDRMLMEGDPFLLLEGMAICGLAVGADARATSTSARSIRTPSGRSARRSRARARPASSASTSAAAAAPSTSRSAAAPGRTSAARRPRSSRASRASAASSAPSRRCRPITGLFGKPDRGQQRHHASRRCPSSSTDGAAAYARLRHGPLARHPALPAGRQHQARRSGREGVRPHPARAALRLRRRHGQRSPDPRGAGRRPAGRVTCPRRSSTRRSTTRRSPRRRHDRPRRHRGVRRHASTWPRMARFAMEFCADRVVRQVHALPDRLDPRRRGDRPDPSRRATRPTNLALLRDLCDTMVSGSLCALGGMTPVPGA